MNRSSFFGGPVPVLVAVLVGVVVALSDSQPALAAPTGECVTVRVDAPFRLPDGLLYPAGALSLCDNGKHSPVDHLHKILVGGSSVGLFVSKRRIAEIRSMDSPQVLFNRDAEGNLTLIGYTLSSSGRIVAYRLKNPSDVWQANHRSPLGVASAAPVAAPVAAIVATAGTR